MGPGLGGDGARDAGGEGEVERGTGEVAQAHGEGVWDAMEGALVERAGWAEVASADEVPDAGVESELGAGEGLGPVVEGELVGVEAGEQVGRGGLAVEQRLGDAFAGDGVDAGGLADEQHAGAGDGLVGGEAALCETLAFAAREVETARGEAGGEAGREVFARGRIAGQDEPIDAAAHEGAAVDEGGEIPCVAGEARVGGVEVQRVARGV